MKDTLNIPVAIIIAGIIVAGAVVYSLNGITKNKGGGVASPAIALPESKINIVPINTDDHLLGSPSAKLTIVEFSDLECPFCKRFHETMKRIMEEYGEDGRVAWVYRHFPLDSIHSKAREEARATECAAEIGGNLGFWEFTDRLFEVTPSNNGLDLAILPDIAKEVGLDSKAFEECLADKDRHKDLVQDDLIDAQNAGGRGTPYSVIVTSSGDTIGFSGALPFETVKQMIDQILAET